jgi:hypothetical protein
MQIGADLEKMILHDNRRKLDRMLRAEQLRWEGRQAGGGSTERARLRLHWELTDDGSGSRLSPIWSAHGWY